MHIFQRPPDADPLIPLIDQLKDLAGTYRAAQPFPHLVLDDWFTETALELLADEYARTEGWHHYEHKKRGLMDVGDHPVVSQLLEPSVVSLLGALTGVHDLVIDPTLRGGGLHGIPAGGRLGIHVDFNRHPDRPLRRSVNMLLYLNKDWDDAWGGQLTLTDRAGTDLQITPRWNRWVIFGYSETAWHGHPEPLTCPPDRERRALALYYYTPMTPAEDADLTFHTTIYADRPPKPA